MACLRRFIYIFLAMVIGALLQSCVNDNDPCDDVSNGIVKLRFNLNLGDMGHISRAVGEDGVNAFDNTIKMNEEKTRWLHVMIINSNGDVLHLNLENDFMLNSSEGGYDISATLDLTDPDKRAKWTSGVYRVMVLANFRDRISKDDIHFSEYADLNSLANAIDGFNVDWFNESGNIITRNNGNVPNIPMWGMTTVRFDFDGSSVQTFSIDLLRAVAKVKIRFSDKLKEAGYKIKQCTVDNLYRKIYGMPNGWKDAHDTSELFKIPYDAAFHVNSSTRYSNMVVAESSNPKDENDGDGSLVFYLPEWNATKERPCVNIQAIIADDLGNEELIDLIISNQSLGAGNYKNDVHNVNRNHLYQFTLDKDIQEGELSYKLECWNLDASAIGWTPPSWTFTSKDSESTWGYVSFPSYNSDDKKDLIENTTSFADYQFTLTSPEGAVWKAFLVENGVEYPAGGNFRENADGSIKYQNSADTPDGFFFGVGNDDKNNNKAASTGIARPEPYNIKVGTRLQTSDFIGEEPVTIEEDGNILAFNAAGSYWKERGEVPTCYLIIKIALDGKNFSECLEINPHCDSGTFAPLVYAGDATRIQIRQLPQFYKSKSMHDNGRHVIGIENDEKKHPDYLKYTWWSYPMGHKDIPVESPDNSEEENP